MKVLMTEYEKLCNEYCEKHKKNWEAHCIANDAWLAGWRKCQEEIYAQFNELVEKHSKAGYLDEDFFGDLSDAIVNIGINTVEKEFKDGEHQLNKG